MAQIMERPNLKTRVPQANRFPHNNHYCSAFHPGEDVPRWNSSKSKASFESVLVPLDGSTLAEHALPLALRVATLAGAQVCLLYMHARAKRHYDSDRLQVSRALDGYIKDEQKGYLADVARRIENASSVRATPILLESDNIGRSLSYSASATADLVVMASHGRGRLGNCRSHSFANQLTNHAKIPLLFIKGRKSPVDLARNVSLKHILIALDGSKSAERALGPAASFANLSNGHCTLLQVLPAGGNSSAGDIGRQGKVRELNAQFAAASGYLEAVASSLAHSVGNVQACTKRSAESAVASILAHSKEMDVDMIAVTSRSRSRLGRLFRPSMVDQLLHQGDLPVLVCPQNRVAALRFT